MSRRAVHNQQAKVSHHMLPKDPGRASVPEGAFSPGSVPQVTTKPTVSLRFL